MLVQCPFNPGHRMPAAALEKHLKKCPDRTEGVVPSSAIAQGIVPSSAPVQGKKPGIVPLSAPVQGKKRQALVDAQSQTKRPCLGQAAASHESRTTSTTLAHLSDQSFDSLDCHPSLLATISDVFQYSIMTKVQAAAIPLCMEGGDVLAKAKTGTGKTLAFLVPALHQVLSNGPTGQIDVLVLSPTRELAMQTEEEAKNLLLNLPEHKVLTVMGGTNARTEAAAFQKHAPLLLVATPGRLVDHLLNNGIAELLAGLQVLVFDEADQLLDMGFRPSIDQILEYLPPREMRQTLLFSATFPQQLQEVSKRALKPEHEVVDCIVAEEATVEQVEQSVLVCSFEDLFAVTTQVLEGLVGQPHKIIVFLPTAREAGLFAELFRAIGFPRTNVLEIHSRKSQTQRTKISEEFRVASNAILFSSDVSARGMDYPDVTFVLQVGSPSDRAQYLHRLGRTARAGKDGAGLLIICDFEKYFLNSVKDLPLVQQPAAPAPALAAARMRVKAALPIMHRANPEIGAQAYQAWLGNQKSAVKKLKWNPAQLVQKANHFATAILKLPQVPALEKKTIAKMGLKGVPGLVAK